MGELLARAGASSAALDEPTIVSGLKQALEVGTRNAVDLTSRQDGFWGNDLIRIPLPESLDKMAGALRSVGFGAQVDELEVKMNRAAEQAASEAAPVFGSAIRSMSFADARTILGGNDTAATDYFRDRTQEELTRRFEPIVGAQMEQVGLARLYDSLAARYSALSFGTGSAPELRSYVTQEALDGLFTMLAQEEQRIRTDPSARVTELLQRVFGSRS